MEKTVTSKKGIHFHLISTVLVVLSLCFSIFYFLPVLPRTVQAFKDLGISFVYYIASAVGKGDMVTPTVNLIPDNAVEVLPFDPEIFLYELKCFGKLLVSKENVVWFFTRIGAILIAATPVVCLAIPALIALGVLLKQHNKRYDKKAEEKYNKNSIFLRIVLRIEDVTSIPVKAFFRSYIAWFREADKEEGKTHYYYLVALGVIWAYNLNLITIAVEAFAYVFYLPASLDVLSILIQIAKLAMDLTVAVDFLSVPVLACIGVVGFDHIRIRIGMLTLESKERHDRKFLDEHQGSLYLTGKPRAKKTSIISDMAYSLENDFREKAKKGLLKRDKQFPYFPWQNVDLLYKRSRQYRLKNRRQLVRFIRALELRFKYRERYEGTQLGEWIREAQRKVYGYDYDNFIFNYSYKRYGVEYNNGLVMVGVFKAVSAYVQQLYIYAEKSSLIYGSYPMRTDFKWKEKKLFPRFDGKFFNRKPRDIAGCSGFSHIADMDFYRLGKRVDPNNPIKDSFEFGIVNFHEWGKERGNQVTNRGIKGEADEANVRNDLLELNMKIQSHASTVDNVTYFRLLCDDQRPDSLGADNKDLCDIIMIKSTSNARVVLPFWGIEKVLGWVAGLFYDKARLDEKENRADNTLAMYIMRKIFTPIFHWIERRENWFSVYTANLWVMDGMTKEVLNDNDKYYLCSKKIYANKFATDAISPFYKKKASRSKIGMFDLPSFKGVDMTSGEMKQVHSHLYNKLNKVFDGDASFYEVEETAA